MTDQTASWDWMTGERDGRIVTSADVAARAFHGVNADDIAQTMRVTIATAANPAGIADDGRALGTLARNAASAERDRVLAGATPDERADAAMSALGVMQRRGARSDETPGLPALDTATDAERADIAGRFTVGRIMQGAERLTTTDRVSAVFAHPAPNDGRTETLERVRRVPVNGRFGPRDVTVCDWKQSADRSTAAPITETVCAREWITDTGPRESVPGVTYLDAGLTDRRAKVNALLAAHTTRNVRDLDEGNGLTVTGRTVPAGRLGFGRFNGQPGANLGYPFAPVVIRGIQLRDSDAGNSAHNLHSVSGADSALVTAITDALAPGAFWELAARIGADFARPTAAVPVGLVNTAAADIVRGDTVRRTRVHTATPVRRRVPVFTVDTAGTVTTDRTQRVPRHAFTSTANLYRGEIPAVPAPRHCLAIPAHDDSRGVGPFIPDRVIQLGRVGTGAHGGRGVTVRNAGRLNMTALAAALSEPRKRTERAIKRAALDAVSALESAFTDALAPRHADGPLTTGAPLVSVRVPVFNGPGTRCDWSDRDLPRTDHTASTGSTPLARIAHGVLVAGDWCETDAHGPIYGPPTPDRYPTLRAGWVRVQLVRRSRGANAPRMSARCAVPAFLAAALTANGARF